MEGVPGQVVVRVEVPGGTVAVEIRGPAGSGSPVVCLHGLTAHRATWEPVARLVEPRRRILLVDLLGRGASSPSGDARHDLASEVDRTRRVLDALGVLRPLLAGHSHGAAIAVALSARIDTAGLLLANPVTPWLKRPYLLRALDLPGVGRWLPRVFRLFRTPLTRYMLVRRVFADAGAVPRDLTARYAEPWGDLDRARGLPGLLRQWDPAELEAYLGGGAEPVRVLAGREDRRVRLEDARRLAQRLHGTFAVLDGCGHSAPEERPEAVAAVLDELLANTDTETTERDRG